MQQLFVSIYDLFRRRKVLFRVLFAASFAVWILLASRIRLEQDVTGMLPDNRAIRAMNDVISHTQAGEQMIFLLSFRDSAITDPDSLISAAGGLVQQVMTHCRQWVDTISLQVSGSPQEAQLADVIGYNLPLFLTEKDYRQLDTLLAPARIRDNLAANRRLLLSPASVVYKQLVARDPVGISGLAWTKLRSLQAEGDYELYDGYLFSDSMRRLSFFMKLKHKSSETGINGKFFTALDKIIEKWELQHPAMSMHYFGGPAVAAGNALQMRTDTMVTLSVTIILLLGITFYFFKRKRTPLLLLVPVAYGAAAGLATVYLVQGTLSVIALGAGAIILGIAIDFSIHFLAHARHARDLRETVRELSHPLTVGSFTTIAAFLSLTLAETPLLSDLGLFAAASLTGAALCTLVFLPHFPLGDMQRQTRETVFDRLGSRQPERNKWLILLIVILTPVLLYFSFSVRFDDDLMHLNYRSEKLKQAQEAVSEANAAALSSMFVIARDRQEDKALQALGQLTPLLDSLTAAGAVRAGSNPALLIPSLTEQQKRITRWNRYWTDERREQVMADIRAAARQEGYAAHAFDGFEALLHKTYRPLDTPSAALLKTLFPGGFARDGDSHFAIAALKVPPEHRKAVLQRLSQQPGITVTDRQQSALQLLEILNKDFGNIALYSSLIVFLALLVGYGRIELALMSFLPMAISWVWILGIMSLLGLKFNVVNIIISTLIFGLGDDYSIFTTDGLMERYKSGVNKLRSVRAAVYLSVTTVIIGLGVLLLAKHPALRSIAFISVVGILCVVFISQTLQPFLFNWFIRQRADKKFLPFTLWSFTKSLFAFFYFFSGSMVLTVLGVLLTKLWPFGRERGRYLFHVWISRYTWSMMYIMGNVRKRVINRRLADFSKPAVYIANHSSFLDILCTTMLHPRLVLLTNKWVWRSPVFGAVVRMAEYYPVAEGAEDSLAPLQDLVRRGYSVVIFPEGTRSPDSVIRRFHKGAFYIAEKLGLDIVPLVLHGIHYTMQKGDWLLKDGTTSVYIYPRIGPDDDSYGKSYSERAKYIGRWMRETLQQIREKEETPSWFREQLIRSYTYKGPVLEWYCRIKTRLEGNYEQFHELLPRAGSFYDLGCGYGFMTYMLHWAAPDRHFTGVDYDGEKIETAQHNFLRDEHIRFLREDLTLFQPLPCDGIIISDVLHYLLPEQQIALLERCVAALRAGGTMIIRDGISELNRRHKTTEITELFSTKIFNFNKTRNELHFLSRSFIEDFACRHQLHMHIVDRTRFTSNLIFVLKKGQPAS